MIGVNLDGERDALGIWFQKTEGAKFWLQVLTDLKQRGVADILICCVDGLTGFPDAIEAVFPQTEVREAFAAAVDASEWTIVGIAYDRLGGLGAVADPGRRHTPDEQARMEHADPDVYFRLRARTAGSI